MHSEILSPESWTHSQSLYRIAALTLTLTQKKRQSIDGLWPWFRLGLGSSQSSQWKLCFSTLPLLWILPWPLVAFFSLTLSLHHHYHHFQNRSHLQSPTLVPYACGCSMVLCSSRQSCPSCKGSNWTQAALGPPHHAHFWNAMIWSGHGLLMVMMAWGHWAWGMRFSQSNGLSFWSVPSSRHPVSLQRNLM